MSQVEVRRVPIFSKNDCEANLLLSALVTGLTGLQMLFRFHDNKIQFRTTAENLTKKKHYHENRCGQYTKSKYPDQLFIERAEALISSQESIWSKEATNLPQYGMSQ
ncbi:MAG: DUF4231 domain-containing protein [Rhodothermaceae bacterium]|nr:DUF4231 domain-containing protein [Rhodothermaceae bacterium]